jgi:hypothetical protein
MSEEWTVRDEWRVTGEPGKGYPPYHFVFDDEDEARAFVAAMRKWDDGPHLEHRQVAETAWEPA